MGGRTLTNILLAIIAGCLLFGGGAMLGGLHVAFWIGIVLLVLFAIIWCIAKYIRSMADEMCKEKTITGKAIVPALYIGLVGIFVSALRAISFRLSSAVTAIGRPKVRTASSPPNFSMFHRWLGRVIAPYQAISGRSRRSTGSPWRRG